MVNTVYDCILAILVIAICVLCLVYGSSFLPVSMIANVIFVIYLFSKNNREKE